MSVSTGAVRLRDLLGVDVRTYTQGSLDAMVTVAQRHGAYYLVEVEGAPMGMGVARGRVARAQARDPACPWTLRDGDRAE